MRPCRASRFEGASERTSGSPTAASASPRCTPALCCTVLLAAGRHNAPKSHNARLSHLERSEERAATRPQFASIGSRRFCARDCASTRTSQPAGAPWRATQPLLRRRWSVEHSRAAISQTMLGGASQIVRRIRMKYTGLHITVNKINPPPCRRATSDRRRRRRGFDRLSRCRQCHSQRRRCAAPRARPALRPNQSAAMDPRSAALLTRACAWATCRTLGTPSF